MSGGFRAREAERSRELAAALAARGAAGSRVALILGSGLGPVAERLADPVRIPFAALPHLAGSGVAGHAGAFVAGTLGGVRLLVQAGRVHLYEGHDVFTVTRSVRACAALGIRTLVVTNAAGGLHAAWPPGTLMRITDHLNLQGRGALERPVRARQSPYDPALGAALAGAARAAGLRLETGVYAGLLGPTYESPAEVRMLRWMGADAVGMSTVQEASVGAALGLAVAGLSCVTNPAAGVGAEPLSHDEVVRVGAAAAEALFALVARALPALCARA